MLCGLLLYFASRAEDLLCNGVVQGKGLAAKSYSQYLAPAPAKSGAGIGTLKSLQATYDAPASFLCRAHSYTPMVGWAGALKGAPVSCNAGSSNPVQSITSEIGTSGGGITFVTGGCHYGYNPYPDTPITYPAFQCRYGFHITGRLL
ncbi:ash family protein [Mangrovibacter phragmitis]|uniref:ash family protein n=1 Tax=Mangrovibacter phragmitis TaxID=1691903 RepID=UPI003513DC5D